MSLKSAPKRVKGQLRPMLEAESYSISAFTSTLLKALPRLAQSLGPLLAFFLAVVLPVAFMVRTAVTDIQIAALVLLAFVSMALAYSAAVKNARPNIKEPTNVRRRLSRIQR
jgi:hypothetical protein